MVFEDFKSQLSQITSLLHKISDVEYAMPINHLGNATIGQHVRHMIEMIQCAISGYESGQIDYFNRNRNLIIENDIHFALQLTSNLIADVEKEDKELRIISHKNTEDTAIPVFSTYRREILYNTEHITHHLALIKVALCELELDLVDKNFGFAQSTIAYKNNLHSN